MKYLFLSISIVLLTSSVNAQISNTYRTQVESIFQVNRNYVTTGLLQDYGFFYTNVEKFNGIRSDTSYLEFSEWQAVYNSLYTYRFNSTAASMPIGASVFDQVSSVALQNTGSIVLAGLHYRYERFKSNAATSNLVYISNNKIYDTPGRPTTPYEVKEAFAMVPDRSVLTGASHSFLFKPELFYSNTGKTISTLKVDFNDGAGYRTLSVNVPMVITYSTEGEKKLIFKVTYTDATSVESHTKIEVRDIPLQQVQSRYAGQNIEEFIFPLAGYTTKPYLGSVGGALVTVEYANPDKVLRKPLIIVSGLDSWKILQPENPEKNWSFEDIIKTGILTKNGNLNVVVNPNTGETLNEALEDEDFDLIFVDYDNGTDYIQRNAYMLESVIHWVNTEKENYNSERQGNVIIGFSMGGVVARYALRDWEIGGYYFGSHETRLNVSVDSPHQGANIPIGMQAAVQHLSGIGIGTGLIGASSSPLLSFGQLFKSLGKANDLNNAPASRQLLRYQVVGSGNGIQIDNTDFEEFMAEYHGMGMPNTRNVAIADGSECGIKQPFSEGASFVNINGKFKTTLMANLLRNVSDPLGDIFDYAQYGALGIPMKTDLHVELKVNSLRDRTASEVYRCKLWIKKKILFVINIDIILIDKLFSSDKVNGRDF